MIAFPYETTTRIKLKKNHLKKLFQKSCVFFLLNGNRNYLLGIFISKNQIDKLKK